MSVMVVFNRSLCLNVRLLSRRECASNGALTELDGYVFVERERSNGGGSVLVETASVYVYVSFSFSCIEFKLVPLIWNIPRYNADGSL